MQQECCQNWAPYVKVPISTTAVSLYFWWKTLCDFQECPNSPWRRPWTKITYFYFFVQIRCHVKNACYLLFNIPWPYLSWKQRHKYSYLAPEYLSGGSETRQFLCVCKQYLLTENSSDGGLGRIFWIADIPMSSSPILSDLCPPSLRICPSMPSKSQSQPL